MPLANQRTEDLTLELFIPTSNMPASVHTIITVDVASQKWPRKNTSRKRIRGLHSPQLKARMHDG